MKAIDELVFDTEVLTEKQFMREVGRMEKHCLHSFGNLTFKQMYPLEKDPELEIIESIKAGIDSEAIEKDELKELLKKSL